MAEEVRSTGKGKVWFITGCSSGFGRLLAEAALKRGDRVVATARDEGKIIDVTDAYPQTALALTVDVTDKNTILIAVQDAIETFGQIDVLVNNAGYGLIGAAEEADDDEIEQIVATNVFGVVDMTRAVLPGMRSRKSGHIVNMSSAAGVVGTAGVSLYNLTKFAVEGFSEGLALEVAPLGIRVSIIEPGPFRTDFFGRSASFAQNRIADYEATAGKFREWFEAENGKQKGDPQKAVDAILNIADSPEPPLRLLLGASALTRAEAKLKNWLDSIDQNRATTLDADFPDEGQRIQ